MGLCKEEIKLMFIVLIKDVYAFLQLYFILFMKLIFSKFKLILNSVDKNVRRVHVRGN